MLIELDKSIIELIWDYMDKTLSEWCLYIRNWKIYKMYNTDIKWESISVWIYLIPMQNFSDNHKILWHYDITAVLNYISKKIPVISIGNERIHSHLYKDWFWCSDVNIPNKPLNLYTEEEKKNLLDLLKKLK